MRFAERLGSAWLALRGKSAPPAGSYSYGWGGGSSWADAFRFRRAPSPSELVDSYKSLVYACVNLNANAVARTPLRLYATTKASQLRPKCAVKEVSRRTKDRLKGLDYASKTIAGAEHVEEVTEHPLLDAVMRVNEDLDHIQLITYTVMSLDIVGSAYWWPFMGRLGVPEELWALPPHLVFPVFTSGTMVPDAYNFGGEIYPKDQLIRFRRLSAKNPYGQGYGPEQAAIEYARLEDTFVSIQDNLLSNGPRPSLIVSHKDPKGNFGPAERQRLEADMERRGRGGRSGGVFVVDGAAAVTPISYTPTDLGALKISSYDMERIANCFDVPVSMLKTEDVNRANAEAGLEQHSRNAVEPRCRLIASTLTRWTQSLDHKGRRGWDRLFWAFDPVVREDKQAEAGLHKTYLDMGVLTRNEVRLELGYARAEGGDELLVPQNLTTLPSVVNKSSACPEVHNHGEEQQVNKKQFNNKRRVDVNGFRLGRGLRPSGLRKPGRFGGLNRSPCSSQADASGTSGVVAYDVETLEYAKKNCGTGAGGFQPGNRCASEHGGRKGQGKGKRKKKEKPKQTARSQQAGSSAAQPKKKRPYKARLGRASIKSYRDTFFAAFPKLKGKVIVHHAIERQVLRLYPGVLDEYEIHSLENLRGIPKALNRTLHLQTIRRKWDAFYKKHPVTVTKEQLLRKATEIDLKYGKKFKPPLKTKRYAILFSVPRGCGAVGSTYKNRPDHLYSNHLSPGLPVLRLAW